MSYTLFAPNLHLNPANPFHQHHHNYAYEWIQEEEEKMKKKKTTTSKTTLLTVTPSTTTTTEVLERSVRQLHSINRQQSPARPSEERALQQPKLVPIPIPLSQTRLSAFEKISLARRRPTNVVLGPAPALCASRGRGEVHAVTGSVGRVLECSRSRAKTHGPDMICLHIRLIIDMISEAMDRATLIRKCEDPTRTMRYQDSEYQGARCG